MIKVDTHHGHHKKKKHNNGLAYAVMGIFHGVVANRDQREGLQKYCYQNMLLYSFCTAGAPFVF